MQEVRLRSLDVGGSALFRDVHVCARSRSKSFHISGYLRASPVQFKVNFYCFPVQSASLARIEFVLVFQPEWSPDLDVVLDVGKNVRAVSQDSRCLRSPS